MNIQNRGSAHTLIIDIDVIQTIRYILKYLMKLNSKKSINI
jgi:hypothetical protein